MCCDLFEEKAREEDEEIFWHDLWHELTCKYYIEFSSSPHHQELSQKIPRCNTASL